MKRENQCDCDLKAVHKAIEEPTRDSEELSQLYVTFSQIYLSTQPKPAET